MREQEYTPSCPERVVKVAAECIGGQAWNPVSPTRLRLEKECAFAIGVWVMKYGALSDAQQEYAWRLFEWAIRDAVRSASVTGERFSHLSQNVRRLVNEDRVDEGMKRRAGRRLSLVDTDGLMVAA